MNILAMNVRSHQNLKKENQNSWKKHICVFLHRGMLNPDNEWKEEDFER
jgi:hypothetical protein